VEVPEPNEYAAQHGHTPFPPRWERWLSALRKGILTGQGIAGQNVSIDVHPGEGTVYNVNDARGRNPIGGGGRPSGCFLGTDAVITLVFSGVTIDGICQTVGTGSFKDTPTIVDINTTYVCTFVGTTDCSNPPCPCGDVPAGLYSSDLLSGAYNQKTWDDPDTNCSGTPTTDNNQDLGAFVYCDCTGLYIALGGDLFFYAQGIVAPGAYTNFGAFNDLITNAYFSSLKSGHGGTVAISW
jgi:hypothetical protein